jgi:hypothetical protein
MRTCSANALLSDGFESIGNDILHTEQRFSPSRSIKCGPMEARIESGSISQVGKICLYLEKPVLT